MKEETSYKKLLLDVAVKNLYESLHQGEFGGVAYDNIPEEEKRYWAQAASKWVENFLSASLDLVAASIAEYLEHELLDHEFPMDATSGMMVVRSEVILNALKNYSRKQK